MNTVDEILVPKSAGDLYDDSPEYSVEVTLNPGPWEDWEYEEAAKLHRFIRGVMLVTAMPRQGKDLFGHWLAWKLKRYFKGRKVFLDEKPRRAFGYYEPFNESVMIDELGKFSAEAGVIPKDIKRTDKKMTQAVKDASEKWYAQVGETKLHNAVMYLTEFHRYMHNRDPFNPIGITLGRIIKVWGHLDLLIMGVAQQSRELDAISCLPFVTFDAHPSWMMTEDDTTQVKIWRTMYVGSKGVLQTTSKRPIEYRINGAAPRPELGINLHREIPYPELVTLSNMETDVIGALKKHGSTDLRTLANRLNIMDVSGLRAMVISMHENDRLKCLRWYDIFNSKSAVSIIHREGMNRG